MGPGWSQVQGYQLHSRLEASLGHCDPVTTVSTLRDGLWNAELAYIFSAEPAWDCQRVSHLEKPYVTISKNPPHTPPPPLALVGSLLLGCQEMNSRSYKEESINVCNRSQDRPLKAGRRGPWDLAIGLLWRAASLCCPRVELSAGEFIDHTWLLPGPPSRPCLCYSLVFLPW